MAKKGNYLKLSKVGGNIFGQMHRSHRLTLALAAQVSEFLGVL